MIDVDNPPAGSLQGSGVKERLDAGVGFVHLRVHSALSLLEGALPIKKLMDLAKADEQPALAIADTNNLFGAQEFSAKAWGAGIQPVTACQLSIHFDDGLESGRRGELALADLVLIAMTETGYGNLMELTSKAFLDTDTGLKPHVTIEKLLSKSEDLIVLTGGHLGPIGAALLAGQKDIARSRLNRLSTGFSERCYIEIQRHGMEGERKTEDAFIDLAYEFGLPLVATNEAFFPKREDYEAHDALICISEGRVLIEDDRRRLTPEHYFKSRSEMCALFADLPEALASTIEIAKRCSFRPLRREPILPRFASADADPEEAERAESEELKRQAREGLQARLDAHGLAPGLEEKDYWERLDYETGIIERMKFPGYFLIVADFIKWAKAQDIPVGPGRGSGAGSLVAWSLTITDLDPMRFSLLFERFLNPERVSMPDFDIDFCQSRREEVIRYVQEKYGRQQVAQIITFGSLQARAVLRDVGRVLQMPYGQVDRLCKLVPANPANPVTLAQAIEDEPRLREAAKEEEIVERLLGMAQKLEGLYRHASTHAAGVVIGDRPLEQLVPLYRDPRSDMPVAQFNMKMVEDAGLVKFDFLGLKTLTVIDTAVGLIERRGVKVDVAGLPIDDLKTYELLARGETFGVFQLESQGMRRAIAGMKPDRFEDIIALVALYRPGPMENIPVYNAVKHGEQDPDCLHPLLETILMETNGIIVYQEQVMQIAQVLSGYSLGEADLLRRAMGKKIAAEMEIQRARFVDGAVERGINKAQAGTIFDLVAKFANYGFNKSHAAAYALVSYHTAWLKANHPVEFMAASMTLDLGNTDKLGDFRQEARRMGIVIEQPSINRSQVFFDVADDRILYAMGAIKGVGEQAVEHIVDVRGDEPFTSLGDFARRISPKALNKRTLENLVAAGAFDELEPNRARVFEGIDRIMGLAQRTEENRTLGQDELFGGSDSEEPLQLDEVHGWTNEEKLQRELSAIGFYLSAHPIDEYSSVLEKMRAQPWTQFAEAVKRGASHGRLAGTVVSMQERKTKSGTRMGIARLSDATGQYEALLFREKLEQYRDVLQAGRSVVVLVGADMRDEEPSLRIEQVDPIDKVAARLQKSMRVFVRDERPIQSLAKQLHVRGEGDVTVIVLLENGAREVEVKLPGRFRLSPEIAGALKAVPGVTDVQVA
ncbi:DNA polymerase III subunit alpha [Roseibium album]|uniref:DNA polymerase III subunit alpha n=1 Tax=Roseibium album TaxID=311410 RepID=A0A0M6ZJD6_9HYPH|nr:DNA polymerase III subunit alpha [Roseibium album]CTQ62865.1 DNA polymerase III subunit alpha [Roseibium album]CTQ68920.1 DNA polymerase III subunit alpha [Roseibium album]CTQ80449.1 DNA polymerase III subunit alpha [Roseibium album]